ncbi:hypothetical protein LA66_07025 [Aureimonas altamirensis]|uniref:Uncharacterized protein n=1 Tax=Aureimonas altamirensis TaxID=370622 RepID=A0A0B1QBV6_9HYPH|nr:hypothetical protein [Aureimonas altamirensis]KHJ56305.1 hypothetical protein LA66_07025 [Aureimonas altamirensis]
MDPNAILIVAGAIVVSLIVRPDYALQIFGVLLIISSPLGVSMPGLGGGMPIVSIVTGMVLIGLGRVVFNLRIIVALIRAASPEAAQKVPARRWFI